MSPLFSLCHITCRIPDGWQNACRIWKLKADHPENCEYVLGLHERQHELPFSEVAEMPGMDFSALKLYCAKELNLIWGSNWRISVNRHRPCIVDNGNACVAASRGSIIVGVADDLRPCDHWDTRLAEAFATIGPCGAEIKRNVFVDAAEVGKREHWVLKVSTGFPEWEAKYPQIITHAIYTRAYYERIGYALWPEYSDYGCDDDFSLQAYKNGVVIERPDIVFPHLTWMNGKRQRDEVDAHTGRKQVWELKESVLGRRIKAGFPEGWPAGFPKP